MFNWGVIYIIIMWSVINRGIIVDTMRSNSPFKHQMRGKREFGGDRINTLTNRTGGVIEC